jgi:hypothetical protein
LAVADGYGRCGTRAGISRGIVSCGPRRDRGAGGGWEDDGEGVARAIKLYKIDSEKPNLAAV